MADQQVMDAIRKRKGPWDSLIDGVSGIPDAISGGLSSARRAAEPVADTINESGSLGMGDLHKLENDYDHTDDSASNPTPMPPRSISNVPAAKPIDDTSDSVKQAIMARSNSNGRDDINRAIDASADNRFRAELGSAGSNFAYAMGGVKNPNAGQFDALKKDANAPVEDLKTKTQMGRQADLQDPNSEVSQRLQRAYGPLLKEAGIDPRDIASVSAADLSDFFEKPAQAIAAIKGKHADRQIMADANNLHRRDLNEAKSGKDQNQALQQVTQMVESARGNPAAAQAEKDIYAASKLKSLLNLHGDPNNLSPEEVQLAATEIAKIASGGVPTTHELQGLNRATIPSALASAAEAVMNKPEGAKKGEFLKRYAQYADQLTNDAQKVITDKYGRIIETNRPRLGDVHYGNLKANYLDRFKNTNEGQQSAPQYKPGDTVQVKGKTYRVGADGDSLEAQ